MVAVTVAVAITAIGMQGNRPVLWIGTGIALSAVLAGILRWRLSRDAVGIRAAVLKLPEPSHAVQPTFSDLDRTFEALNDASQRLQRRLKGAQDERLQLEALLDSMQDAVVAVDEAGRIQWTNQKMQRLIPGASVQSPVRIGHALVQTIRDPDVLECVRASLDERVVCERRTTTMVPGRIFEVNASPMPGGGAVAVLHDITGLSRWSERSGISWRMCRMSCGRR